MQKWIDILDDQKPDNYQWVLVAFDRQSVSLARYRADSFDFEVVQSFDECDSDNISVSIRPTHWRKLPKHPIY